MHTSAQMREAQGVATNAAGPGSAAPPQAQAQQRTRPTQASLVEAAMTRSPCPLIDIGVNLVDPSFAKDRQRVIERARSANVIAIVVTGTCVRTSRAAAALCDEFMGIFPLYFTAGVHPHNAKVTPCSLLRTPLASCSAGLRLSCG